MNADKRQDWITGLVVLYMVGTLILAMVYGGRDMSDIVAIISVFWIGGLVAVLGIVVIYRVGRWGKRSVDANRNLKEAQTAEILARLNKQ